MTFALIAELPLGTYRAHVGSGDIDMIPSAARLHAALLCAAGSGPRAEMDGDHLVPSGADLGALKWLETHPPDGITVPRSVVNRSTATAFRELGLTGTRNKRPVLRKLGRPATVSVAVDGPFAWEWDDPPPAPVADALARLCSDVSHLGTSETPVRLRVDELGPTHRRDDDADLFAGSGLDLEVPGIGRTAELITQEEEARGQMPSRAQDRPKANEEECSGPPRRAAVGVARYCSLQPVGPSLPWSQVLLLPIDREIDPAWRVRWAACAHRALVALVGNDAPATLTGAYPDGASRPANRVAIQFLGRETLSTGCLEAPATLAVLIPTDTVETDMEVVTEAVGQLGALRGPGGRVARRQGHLTALGASRFWAPLPAGCERRWLTDPAAVPDGRPPRRSEWSMADVVSLSVGLVWRDVLSSPGRGASWQIELAGEAQRRGVAVEGLRMVTDGDLTRFVHKVNPGVVVRPYRALVDLGALASPQSLVAIGQSRHLGGGLLRPVNVVAASQGARP